MKSRGPCVAQAGQKAWNPRIIENVRAGVAELADAVALGATGRKSLEVQILSPAPSIDAQYLRRSSGAS
jgi:hypothetical protein